MKTFTQRIVESSADYLSDDFRTQLIAMLVNAYKEELNAFYAYFIVKEFLVGINRKDVEEFFEEAAKDELYDHAAYLLKRINQLGGCPIEAASPSQLATSKHPYIVPMFNIDCDGKCTGIDVKSAIKQNIEAEQGAIETYRAIAEFTQSVDIVTHKEIKRILEDEVEHLQELTEFLDDLESCGCCSCNDDCCCDKCDNCCCDTCDDCENCECDKCDDCEDADKLLKNVCNASYELANIVDEL